MGLMMASRRVKADKERLAAKAVVVEPAQKGTEISTAEVVQPAEKKSYDKKKAKA